MKIGCCISIKNLSLAKDFGYDFAELSANEIMKINSHDWKDLKNQILDVGLPIIGFNSFCDSMNPLVGPDVNTKKLIAYLDEVISRAVDLHARNIGIGAPKGRILTDDFPYDKASEQMDRFLLTAAEHASKYNINILYEAIHPHSCNFGNATKEIYDTVKRLHKDNLNVVWDIYHAINAGESIEQSASLLDSVHHVHICSWNQQLQRFYLLKKDQAYLNDFMDFLKLHHYDKTISIEASDNDFANTGEQALLMIKNAINN